ncbi:MAG: hypothetical protein ACJAYX_002496 [Planctomycetota bacterium]|jgi:hypothetical protein
MLLCTIVAALFATSQGPSGTANVDDPQSHGTVGDSKLSLDEAIQLANGSLSLASLSAAEQARVSGTGAVNQIIVDCAVTPIITIQTPLTNLTGPTPANGMVTIMGVPAGGSLPVLDGGSQATILAMGSRELMVHGLRFENGGVAVDAKMPAPANPVTGMAMVANCEFEAQTSAAVQLRGTGTDKTRLMVRDCSMQNMPLGYRLDDQTSGGQLMSENERITMDGVTLGCDAFEGGFGQATMWQFWRSSFINGETLAKTRRSPTATQLIMLRIVYSDATCSGDVIDMEGTTAGTSMVHHHHGDWVAGAGKRCLWTHPRTAQFDVHGSEMVFDGDIVIAGGTTSPRFWHQNNQYKNCAITFDVAGALPNLLLNRYENCTITVPALARSPVIIRDSHMSNTDIDSQSFLAPVTVVGCYRVGGALTGFVSESSPAPTLFLGSTEVSPQDPQVGTSLQLSTDLPPGIALFWDIAISYARPVTSQEPVRFYGDPATVILLPAIAIYQTTLTIPIPLNPGLIGLEFYAQGIAVPWQAMPHAPAYQLPRGGRINLRL